MGTRNASKRRRSSVRASLSSEDGQEQLRNSLLESTLGLGSSLKARKPGLTPDWIPSPGTGAENSSREITTTKSWRRKEPVPKVKRYSGGGLLNFVGWLGN